MKNNFLAKLILNHSSFIYDYTNESLFGERLYDISYDPTSKMFISLNFKGRYSLKTLTKIHQLILLDIYEHRQFLERALQQSKNEMFHTDALEIYIIEALTTVDDMINRHKKLKPRTKYKNKSVEIQELKTIPITDYLDLNGSGFAKCIWHNEKTASLKYYPKSNTIYCFGCQKYGSVIDVIMQQQNMTLQEAINFLANENK